MRNVANWSPPVLPKDDEDPDEWEILLRLASVVAGGGPDPDVAALDRLVAVEAARREAGLDVSPIAGQDPEAVVDALTVAPGLRLAIGVGEAPIGLQGTFSLWDSGRDLVDFAYRSPAHVETIARTEPSGWYSEELFARFAVLEVEGTHRGRVP